MGSWRRMGAFLGLVPGEDGDESEFADDYAADPYAEPGYADGAYREPRPGYDEAGYTDGAYREPRVADPGAGHVTALGRRDDPGRVGAGGSSRSRREAFAGGYGDTQTHGALAMQVRPQVSREAAASTATASRPLTVKLTGFGEARMVGEKYRGGSSVILDMTDLSDADARRVVDFAAGLAFAMRGSIDKVTTRVFMLLPPDAGLSAEDRRAYAGSYASR